MREGKKRDGSDWMSEGSQDVNKQRAKHHLSLFLSLSLSLSSLSLCTSLAPLHGKQITTSLLEKQVL